MDRDNPGVQIIHRGKYKPLSAQKGRWLKRRQAVEPAIGHLKADHRMNRCWLAGATGDAIHAVLCAVGYNLRWLLRAIVERGIKPLFLRLCAWWRQQLTTAAARLLHRRLGIELSRGSRWRLAIAHAVAE